MPIPPPSSVSATNAMRRRVTSTSRLSASPPQTPPIILSVRLRCMRNGGLPVVGAVVFSMRPACAAATRRTSGSTPDPTRNEPSVAPRGRLALDSGLRLRGGPLGIGGDLAVAVADDPADDQPD